LGTPHLSPAAKFQLAKIVATKRIVSRKKTERQKWISAAVPKKKDQGEMLLNTLLGKMPLKFSVALNISFSLPFLISHLSLLEMREKGRD